ncbi:unnamed protein product [Clonostachys rosea]|uniref:Uncharacterized protein n=1 Tax=Bionectria ochroleuca TaxID=29856 RepID=A0ABY6U3W3_BIOOC|nr:unnamed protein product [Clonostachys rosea]
MDSSPDTVPPHPRKRKAQDLDDENDKIAVVPPKHLHASITWDVRAEDMAHYIFCTQFVAIMDAGIKSRKLNADIQKKCMNLMCELKLSEQSAKEISNHPLVVHFLSDSCFIRIMMLKVLYPLEKIKRCDFLQRFVPLEYPGWDYCTQSYPPSKYPTSQPTESELEAVRESIEGMDKLLKEIYSAVKDIKNKLKDETATEDIASKGTKTRRLNRPPPGTYRD